MTAAQPEIDHAAAEEVSRGRRKGPMDQVIEALASGLGNSVGWLAEHGVLFIVFAVIWVAFGAGLLLSEGSLDQAWQAIRGLPLIVQVLVWLLFLPVMIGLWVWETTWPLILRLVVVLGIAGWNLLVFLPKAFQAARP
jgi:ABC-type amino acid transport system permease subunit